MNIQPLENYAISIFCSWCSNDFPLHDDVTKMETFSALLALCAVNSPVTGEFPVQRPVTRSFDVFFDHNKRLSKQSWVWWFETPSRSLWPHCNDLFMFVLTAGTATGTGVTGTEKRMYTAGIGSSAMQHRMVVPILIVPHSLAYTW